MGIGKVSLFERVFKPTLGRDYNLTTVLGWIKMGENGLKERIEAIRSETDKENQNSLKFQNLPIVTMAGTCDYRSDNNIKVLSGVLMFDFDGLDELAMHFGKELFCKRSYVLSVFVTPSGHGLKVLVLSDNLTKDNYGAQYEELMDILTNDCVGLDRCCSNISRATYLSYDPDLYYNPNCRPYHYTYNEEAEVIAQRKRARKLGTKSDAWSDNMAFQNKIFNESSLIASDKDVIKAKNAYFQKYRSSDFEKGNRNKGIYVQSCELCRAGVSLDVAKEYLRSTFGKVGVDVYDVDERVENGYKSAASEFGKDRSKYKPFKNYMYNARRSGNWRAGK